MRADKAISVVQPWASLMVAGIKTVETRSRNTSHRGPLWIQASGQISRPVRDAVLRCPYLTAAIRAGGFESLDAMPLGKILGRVDLFDSHRMQEGFLGHEPWRSLPSEELRYGHYEAGRFGWFCRRAVQLAEPIVASGKLGFWYLPPAALRAIEALSVLEPTV